MGFDHAVLHNVVEYQEKHVLTQLLSHGVHV